MVQIFVTLLAVVATFLAYTTQQANAAATSNGQLLKFYPISYEQYASLRNLMREEHPVVPEARVLSDGHRSIADWSFALPEGWNNIFDLERYFGEGGYGGGKVKGYPLCVLKANVTKVRGKRGARQNDYYAGVAPSVVYTSDGYPYYVQHDSPGQEVDPPVEEEDNPPADNGMKPPASVIVNCIVVIRRKSGHKHPSRKPGMIYPYRPHPHPGYPPYGYPPHHYPPHHYPHPPPSPPSTAPRQFNGNVYSPTYDPASQLMFQAMLSQYYQQLNTLYMANTVTQAAQWAANGGLGYGNQLQAFGNQNDDDEEYYDDTDNDNDEDNDNGANDDDDDFRDDTEKN